MRKLIYIASLTLGIPCLSQNLVPNPDLELMNDCNFSGHPIEGAISDWFTYNYQQNTVDVLNTCLAYPGYQPPNTIRGFAYPHSGNGMLGIGYIQEMNYREVASVELTQKLIADSAYCVSFWIKNSKIQDMYYWVEQIGCLFTNSIIDNQIITNSIPHIQSHADLGQTEWIEISSYYIAHGEEKYINIGYFGPSIQKYQSHPFEPGTDYAPFYFLDDVSVTPCNKDSLLAVICKFPNVFSPDGNAVNDLYTLQLRNIKKLDIQIFNRWGNVVKSYDGVTEIWDGTDEQAQALVEGVYFIKALAETNFGELIPKYQYVHLVR